MKVAITGGPILVGTGETIENGAVIIADGVIADVVRKGASPGADRVVDVGGRTIMPGMLDLHVHMVGGNKAQGFGDEATTFRMYDLPARAVLEGVGAARTTLHAGFTSVREVGGRGYFDIALRNAQRDGLIDAPRIFAAGPGVFVTGGPGAYLEPTATIDDPQSAILRVRQLVGHGVDVIKLVTADGPPGLGPHWTVLPTREEIFATFAEATRLGRIKAAHAMGPEAIGNVVEAGVDTVEHGWYISEENCRRMIERGTYLVPTISNLWSVSRRGAALLMPWAAMTVEDEPGILDRLRMAIAMGVNIALGTDVGGNESYRHVGENAREIEIYVQCGMTPTAAIGAATLGAAKAIHRDATIGSLEAGKTADLIVIDGDPLADISLTRTGVVAVMQGGRVHRDDLGIFDTARELTRRPPRV